MYSFLDEVYGQEKVKKLLVKFFNNKKLPQALLFVGPEGVGKFNTAIQFLKLLNSSIISQNPNVANQISAINEPYVKIILPLPRGKNEVDDNPYAGLSDSQISEIKNQLKLKAENPYYKLNIPGAESIKISSIRDITNFTSLSYNNINYRMILILDAHLMGDEAQNALLKNLEEPPEGVIYILTTSNEDALLSTIKSRCWKISFNELSLKDIITILIKYYNYSKEELSNFNSFTLGSIASTIYLLENGNEKIINKAINILRFSFAGWYNTAFYEFNDIIKKSDYELIKIILILVYIWLNNLELYRVGGVNKCYPPFLDSIIKFNTKYPDLKVNSLLNELDYLYNYLDKNVNLSIIAANIIISLSNFTNN